MFARVEDYMDGRVNKKRDEKLRQKAKEFEKEKVNYKEAFREEKAQLKEVTRNEWESLPEAKDLVSKSYKRKEKYSFFTAVPDSMLQQALEDGQTNQSIDPTLNAPAVLV